jgi:hypothetical protein
MMHLYKKEKISSRNGEKSLKKVDFIAKKRLTRGSDCGIIILPLRSRFFCRALRHPQGRACILCRREVHIFRRKVG